MRLLILGGTQFLGQAVAARACALGHHVTCAARGLAGSAPSDAHFVTIDRDRTDGLASLAGTQFDAAVDVSRHPGQVRRAYAALAEQVGHWTFVSTTSVYADSVTRGQTATSGPLLPPTKSDVDHSGPQTYGAAKVACEEVFGRNAFICRPGLIVGPGDPTGRFTYWAVRLARGGEMLVPDRPDDPLQYIDVRDLAAWIVRAAEGGLTGRFAALSPSRTRLSFLEQGAAALGTVCRHTWVSMAFLEEHGVRTGSGPRSLPYPIPDTDAEGTRDITGSLAAGLMVKPLAETLHDTLSWLRASGGPVAGLTAKEETALLAAWHAERDGRR
jgi:nucleoside-diphosphate-sugar epimerase